MPLKILEILAPNPGAKVFTPVFWEYVFRINHSFPSWGWKPL